MQLYAHQQAIIDEDRKKTGLFLGCGTGKTITALGLARKKVLVIAPKTTVEDRTWEKNWDFMIDKGVNVNTFGEKKVLLLTVISKETFRRDAHKLPAFDTVIFDEAHTVAGLTPMTCQRQKAIYPKMSQLMEAVLTYLKRTNPERVYTVTATPTRSPMCVLGLAWMLGKEWDFYKFRDTFYSEVRMGNRRIWMAKRDSATKERLGLAVQKLGYTGRMSDYFDVPRQSYVVKQIPLTSDQLIEIDELKTSYPDPIVQVTKIHQVEQGVLKGNQFEPSKSFRTNKLEAIADLVEEYPKVLIFAKYTEQIRQIEHYIVHELGHSVYTLTGETQHRGELLKAAEKDPRCVVICQSSISAGYELPSFRCTIYASMSYSFVDKEQSEWRTLRSNALDKNLYVYLLAGKVDNAVYAALQNKQDFHEAQFAKII